MTDLWSFLLQTLTASGVAVLLLVVKGMFQDKLPPRWQFSTWSVLALVLLLPAGLGGRYALVDWAFLLETLRSSLTGSYGTLTQVIAPVPLPVLTMPDSVSAWLYALYVLGAALFLLRYFLFYLRLRLALRRAQPETDSYVQAAAQRYGLPICPVVKVPGLPSAFICGVFRPILALPADTEPDEKVLLHELMHLKYHDAAWGLFICFLRCLHWCNPLLWACANLAQNDLESLCDQRVLERLAGEDRRNYGHILLDMADEKYARVPGTSSMANGAKNIRRRIKAIARFKKYPAGMTLVSVCVILALAVPLLVGSRSEVDLQPRTFLGDAATAAMAKARTVRCTTPDGAIDCYARAVITRKAEIRAICAPLSEQDALAAEYRENGGPYAQTWTSLQLPGSVSNNAGYLAFNCFPDGNNAYICLLGIQLESFPKLAELTSETSELLAVQHIRAEKQDGRWVVLPLEDFQDIVTHYLYNQEIKKDIPTWTYEAQAGDFILQAKLQTSAYIEHTPTDYEPAWTSPWLTVEQIPQPHGTFASLRIEEMRVIYTGTEEGKKAYSKIDIVSRPMMEEGKRPKLPVPGGAESLPGTLLSISLAEKWPAEFSMGTGSTRFYGDFIPPAYYAVDLYLNNELAAELTLLPKGGPYD